MHVARKSVEAQNRDAAIRAIPQILDLIKHAANRCRDEQELQLCACAKAAVWEIQRQAHDAQVSALRDQARMS